MRQIEDGTMLRVFIGESDRYEHRPLHEAIVAAARAHGMAGATVLRGVEGYGAASVIHTARILRLSEDLPIIVELVDSADRIDGFVTVLNAMIEQAGRGALMTTERVHVIRHTAGHAPAQD